MNRLTMVDIYDRGVPNKERLHISVSVETNLSFYVVLLSAFTLGRQGVMAGYRAAYWFNPTVVRPGDWVVLYTGPGSYSTAKRPEGGTIHFFYWGLPNTIWASSDSCAVLCELNTWTTK